jgi:CRP-like cAMP-binding protein
MATIDTFKYEQNVVSFPAGETIFEEGQPGNTMYIVQHGEVEVFVRGKLIESVGENGVVGEMALIDTNARSATAIAKTDCMLVPLDEAAFKRHVHYTPLFAVQVMRVMAHRLRQMNTQL